MMFCQRLLGDAPTSDHARISDRTNQTLVSAMAEQETSDRTAMTVRSSASAAVRDLLTSQSTKWNPTSASRKSEPHDRSIADGQTSINHAA
jgi:hypothetical protein